MSVILIAATLAVIMGFTYALGMYLVVCLRIG
jgi:hypothetical protein